MTHADAQLSRRRFVQAGTTAAAVLAVGTLGPLASAQAAGVASHLRRASYADLVGTPFVTAGGSELRLEEVADLARAAGEPEFTGRDDAFALTLVGPPGLPAATHGLWHAALGSFALFLVPVGSPGATQRYEVVVDRSVRLADAVEEAPEPMARANDGEARSSGHAAAEGAGAGAASAAAGPTRKKARAKTKPRRVLATTLARRGGVLATDVRVARGRGLKALQVSLVRDEIVVARGFRRLGRRVGLRLTLRERRLVRAGDYWLHVTTTDGRGRRATSKHRVTLR